MASTLPKAQTSIPVNSREARLDGIDRRCAKASIDVNRQEASASTSAADPAVSLFFDTLAAIGMSEKEAAYSMGIDPAQLSRVKAGQGRLPLEGVWRLPSIFWTEFRRRIDQAKGLSEAQAEDDYAALVGKLVEALLKHRIVRRERAAS